MSRRTRREGVEVRGQRSAERDRARDPQPAQDVEDTLDRVRRLATDTAELLIVHESQMGESRDPDVPNPLVVEALRRQVDTGDYAVLPDAVAEAMVRRAKKLSNT